MTVSDIVSNIREWLAFRLFEVGGTVVTGASVVTFILIVLASFWVSRVVQRIVVGLMHRSRLSHEGTVATTRRLLHYAVMLLGVGVALQSVGISLASVFAAGAVVAVAIGFALQNILQNFVSGLILLGERSIKETDVLEVEGAVVTIERMGARATVARTRDDEELIIPNSILVQSTVKNLTLTEQVFRLRTSVGVSYASDMRLVEKVLIEAATGVAGRSDTRDPVVVLHSFGDSAVNWEISVWSSHPWTAPGTRSDLNKAVWFALADAGITIAFPQLDVHIDRATGSGGGPASP